VLRLRAAGLIGILSVFFWVMVQPAQAVWFNMTPEQAKRAEKVGGFNASNANPTSFMQRWVVNLGEDKGAALLMTEFLSVAFAAQEAALNFAALQPWEVEDAVARARGKLVFSVTTFDSSPDYADGLRGWVIYNGKKIQNSHWQNGKVTAHKDKLYTADSTFWFLADGIDPEGKVTLIIEDSGNKKRWEFPFDLAAMR